MKKLLFPILFILVHQVVFAQISGGPAYVYLETNATTWTCSGQPAFMNLTPANWNTINNATYGPTIENPSYTQNCGIIGNYTNPGVIITPPVAPCDFVQGTVYYKTSFEVPFSGICDAIMRVRADNNFRVYINGQNVVGGLFGCGLIQGQGSAGLLGNLFTTVYTINIQNFIVPGTNTVIIEVQNCPGPSPNPTFVSASIRINKTLVGQEDAAFTINLGVPTNGALTGTFDGTDVKNRRRPTNVSWKVEESLTDGNNGPWTTIFSQNTTNTQISTILTECKWYRVTRTVTNGCSTVSFVRVFQACDPGKPGEEIVLEYEQSNGGLSNSDDDTFTSETGLDQYNQAMELTYPDPKGQVISGDPIVVMANSNQENHLFTIAPNPSSDFIHITYESDSEVHAVITDLSGRICATAPLQPGNSNHSLSLQSLTVSGLYIIRLVNTNTGALLSAQKLQVIK